MTDLPLDPLELMRNHPDAMNVPGGMLTKEGPQKYVGAVPAVAGTLFFNDAHLPAVRNAIAKCFDAFVASTKPELTWLFREDPPEGAGKMAFKAAKPLKTMLAALDEDDLLSFQYTSGKNMEDAGPWEFHAYGLQGWRAKMGGWGLSGLRFSVPLLFMEEHPGVFQELFVDFARCLKAVHGYGGHSLVLSALRYDNNQAFEAYLASRMRGFDAGNLVAGAVNAHLGIKTVSWLTAINKSFVEQVGGEVTLRSELPMDWFRLLDYEEGIVIQAGPEPDAAPIDSGLPARMVLPNMLLQPLRASEMILHFASAESEPRLIGKAAEDWLARFDIPVDQILAYKARLLDEPKLRTGPKASARRK